MESNGTGLWALWNQTRKEQVKSPVHKKYHKMENSICPTQMKKSNPGSNENPPECQTGYSFRHLTASLPYMTLLIQGQKVLTITQMPPHLANKRSKAMWQSITIQANRISLIRIPSRTYIVSITFAKIRGHCFSSFLICAFSTRGNSFLIFGIKINSSSYCAWINKSGLI